MSKNSKQKQTLNSKREIDKYEIIKLLGEGSFGRVYKAKVIADSSFVALKVICKARRSNKEIIGLRRECEIQRHLHHPNIIQMVDSFETPSEIVVVTEFAHKELYSLLGKEGYLSEERAAPIIWDLVSALNYLHSHRVLHRDLKPQNILLDSKNRAKLCDFGFARNMSTGTHVLTSIKGTPLYMAPELIEEQPYDYKADLWSLGCIMYELLVGAPPFCTASILHLIRLIRHEEIQWPTFVSKNCISFLQGLLQKDPNKRIGWQDILNHNFVKSHILICEDSTNMPLTKPLTPSTLQVREQQKKDCLSHKSQDKSTGKKTEETKVSKETASGSKATSPVKHEDSQDMKNNNFSSNQDLKNSSSQKSIYDRKSRINFVEEKHPLETDEWIVFLQKTMEEVINEEMTSLTQPQLINIIVSPLRNINSNPKVISHVAKLLSIPFALRGISQETKQIIKKVYVEVKLVPNLVYSSKQIMKVKQADVSESSSTPSSSLSSAKEICRDTDDLTEEELQSLEQIYMLITHLVHIDNEFLLQLCDSIALLNVFTIYKKFLATYKNKIQLVMDILAILTQILRVFPENCELIEKIILDDNESDVIKFIDLLRCSNPVVQERTCLFLFYLGKYLNVIKMEVVWNQSLKETLEALMYDSTETVRNAADRAVDELKFKEFYKSSQV